MLPIFEEYRPYMQWFQFTSPMEGGGDDSSYCFCTFLRSSSVYLLVSSCKVTIFSNVCVRRFPGACKITALYLIFIFLLIHLKSKPKLHPYSRFQSPTMVGDKNHQISGSLRTWFSCSQWGCELLLNKQEQL